VLRKYSRFAIVFFPITNKCTENSLLFTCQSNKINFIPDTTLNAVNQSNFPAPKGVETQNKKNNTKHNTGKL
jgi:hypothetical protein